MNRYPKYKLSSFNSKLILGSFIFITFSYILMYMGSKNGFEILSLTISPIMQVIGYITIVVAIIKN